MLSPCSNLNQLLHILLPMTCWAERLEAWTVHRRTWTTQHLTTCSGFDKQPPPEQSGHQAQFPSPAVFVPFTLRDSIGNGGGVGDLAPG